MGRKLLGTSGCLLSGRICTHHFRFRRQLLWPFSQKSSLLFREQPSEAFRKESIESAVHEPSSDRYWWYVGQEKVCLIGLLHCKNDRYRFRGFFFFFPFQFTTKFVLFGYSAASEKKEEKKLFFLFAVCFNIRTHLSKHKYISFWKMTN